MGLTQVSTDGVKNDAITKVKIPANQIEASEIAANAVTSAKIADSAVSEAKLGSSVVSTTKIADSAVTAGKLASGVQTTINNNAANRVITGSGTANTLEGNSNFTYTGSVISHSNPSGLAKLEVKGGVSGGALGASLTLRNTDAANNGLTDIQFLDAGSNTYAKIQGTNLTDSSNNGFLSFFTASATSGLTERMRIEDSGNVGIGLTNPLTKLHVQQDWVNNVGSIGVEGSSNALVGYGFRSNGTYKAALIYRDGTAGNYLDLGTYNGNYPILFRPNATEEVRIDNDGLKFNGDTAAANALDDYEEGTWTPGAEGFSISSTYSARYTKIGRIVHASCYVQAATGTGSSTVNITGLPYTAVSGNIYSYGAGRLGSANNNNAASDIVFQMQNNTTKVKPYVNDGGINHSMISGTHIIFSIVYEAA